MSLMSLQTLTDVATRLLNAASRVLRPAPGLSKSQSPSVCSVSIKLFLFYPVDTCISMRTMRDIKMNIISTVRTNEGRNVHWTSPPFQSH